MASPPRVLYLAGHARSGSTLLGNLLNELPGVLHVGEVIQYQRRIDSAKRCGCGREIRACPLWQDVVAAVGPDPQMADLYRAIHTAADTEWVVDGSKRPDHLARLQRALGPSQVAVVHVVRDPRAAIYSMLRSSRRRADKTGRPSTRVRGCVSVGAESFRWRRLVRRLSGVEVVVRYEDLVADPNLAIGSLAARSGLPALSRDLVQSADGVVRFESVNHSIWGNRSRMTTDAFAIREDDAWKREMPRLERTIVRVITRRGRRRLGYGSDAGRAPQRAEHQARR